MVLLARVYGTKKIFLHICVFYLNFQNKVKSRDKFRETFFEPNFPDFVDFRVRVVQQLYVEKFEKKIGAF